VKTFYIYLLLLLVSLFSRVRLCATPERATHQALPSLGFSRQEHWSGLPFPSPMHESEKWKWSRSVASDSYRAHGLRPTRLLHPWDFPGKSTGVGCHCLLRFIFLIEPTAPIPCLNFLQSTEYHLTYSIFCMFILFIFSISILYLWFINYLQVRIFDCFVTLSPMFFQCWAHSRCLSNFC